VRLSNGSVGNINYFATGDRAFPKERIEVFGGGRVGVLDDFRSLDMWHDGRRRVIKRRSQDKGFDLELFSFIQAVRLNGEMPIAWRSILVTTLTSLRIEDALRSGKPKEVVLNFNF